MANKAKIVIEEDPCWKGYKQIGMKKKNGKKVPNCVPEAYDVWNESCGYTIEFEKDEDDYLTTIFVKERNNLNLLHRINIDCK